MVLGFVGIALFVAALAAVLIFLIIFISKFCCKNSGLIEQLVEQRIYGKEGTASMPLPKIRKKNIWLEIVFSVVFFICFFGSWYLSMKGYIASKYLQPISVFYIVPLLVSEYFQRRPRLGPLFLIFPALYTIHAIVIVAGVPIFFTGNLCMLNIFLPVVGYMFLAYVICHVYSRYALKKLKRAAHLEEGGTDGA